MLRKVRQEFKQGKILLQFGLIQAIGQAFGMIAPLVVAKFFSPDLFGSYSLASMILFFFLTLLIVSSQAPFIVLANRERAQSGRINKSFSIQFVFFVVGFCIFIVVTLPLNRHIAAFAKISCGDLFFVLLAFPGLALKSFLCNLFMALGQRIKSSIIELVHGSVTLGLVLALSLTGKLTLRTVFLSYFISALFVVFVTIKSVDFNQIIPFSIDKRYVKEMFSFTKWILLGSTAVYFINWGDNLVLRLFVSMADIGQYNLGYQVFKGVVMLAFIINSYFLPFVSEHIGNKDKMRDYLFNKRPKIFLPALVILGLIFVVFPYVLGFYGDVYGDSISVLRVLLVASALLLYTVFYTPILNALQKYKFSQTVILLQALLNLLLNFLLVPVMGMLGAAVSTVLAYFCWTVAIEIYFRVRLKKTLQL